MSPHSEETILKKLEQIRERYAVLTEDPKARAWFDDRYKGKRQTNYRAVDFLMEEIVHTGICSGCTACVVICPWDIFDYVGNHPEDTRTDRCTDCGLCVQVCPEMPVAQNLRENIFGEQKGKIDDFGFYLDIFLSRSKIPEVRARAQDGGTATTLLLYALQKGLIKGAVVGDVSKDTPGMPVHKLATTKESLLSSSGSRYVYSPNMLAIEEAFSKDIAPIAVVGVPCQVDGLRYIQHGGGVYGPISEWYRRNVALSIGLFCSEAFVYDGIVDLARQLNIGIDDIKYFNIKGKVIVKTDDKEYEFPLKEFRRYARPACEFCKDYSAELADIGLGGIGLSGWTMTVTRTASGQKIIDDAIRDGYLETRSVGDAPESLELLKKLCRKKKMRPFTMLK